MDAETPVLSFWVYTLHAREKFTNAHLRAVSARVYRCTCLQNICPMYVCFAWLRFVCPRSTCALQSPRVQLHGRLCAIARSCLLLRARAPRLARNALAHGCNPSMKQSRNESINQNNKHGNQSRTRETNKPIIIQTQKIFKTQKQRHIREIE